MSQSSSAVPRDDSAAHRSAGSALAPRNWRVACRLIVLVTVPTVLGLALTGLRITGAARSAQTYSQVSQLAMLGQQVTGLAQAMEDERAAAAAFIADGRPATGLAVLHRQFGVTDGWAADVRRLVLQLGPGYPAQTRTGTSAVLASIAELPGLRRRAAQRQTTALAETNGYSAATADLFPINDGIADLSSNSALIASVRALGSLSRMKDQASLQQAILGAALAEGRFGPGASTALTIARVQQADDFGSFRGSATPEESWALTDTLSDPRATQARAVEQHATGADNGALALDAHASQQWAAGMSFTVGWMRHAEQQLTGWITAYAQAQQRNATRSAIVTGGAALAFLILVLLATLIIARSMVRPLRRLEAAALDIAGERLPAEIRALGAAGNAECPLPVAPIDVLSTDEIGHIARALDRVHREAVRLAGEEARLRGSVSAIFASFFRRSHSLLERLLRLIDRLELGEKDPERLASLFQMDHLVTRMRRNSDSALVLAGQGTPRRWTEPVTLVNVLRAAVSEIEQYDRVILDVQRGVSVSGKAAADTVHLLAELLENATAFSGRTTQVKVAGHMTRDGGAVINIADQGTGMSGEQLRQLNWQLAHPPLADAAVARRIGLFAVGHLAARHGIKVELGRPPGGGTTAKAHLPAALILPDAKPGRRLGQAGKILHAETGREAGAVPLPLGAPLSASARATSPAVIVPEPAGGEPCGALPIFESVQSDYRHTRSQGPLRPGEPQAAALTQASQPDADRAGEQATDTAAPGKARADRRAASAADARPAGGVTSAGLPQRIPQANLASGAAANRESWHPMTAESARIARGRLASFQRGSRRARAVARMDREAKQQARDD